MVGYKNCHFCCLNSHYKNKQLYEQEIAMIKGGVLGFGVRTLLCIQVPQCQTPHPLEK